MNAVNPIQTPNVPSAGGAEPSMEEILASIRRIIADDGTPARLIDGRGHDREADEIEPHADWSGRETGMHPPHVPAEVEQALEPLLREPGLHEPASHKPSLDEPLEPPTHDLTAHEPSESMLDSEHGNAPRFPALEGPMAETAADLPPHPLAPAPEVMGLGSIVHDEPTFGRAFHPHDDVPPTGSASEASSAPERLFSTAAGSSVTAAFNTLAASRFVDNTEQLNGLVSEMIRPLVKAWVDEHLPGMVERLVVAEIERMARGGR